MNSIIEAIENRTIGVNLVINGQPMVHGWNGYHSVIIEHTPLEELANKANSLVDVDSERHTVEEITPGFWLVENARDVSGWRRDITIVTSLPVIEGEYDDENWGAWQLSPEYGGGEIVDIVPVIQGEAVVGYEFTVVNPNESGDDFLTRKIHL